MRTIREYIDKKYAEHVVGKETFEKNSSIIADSISRYMDITGNAEELNTKLDDIAKGRVSTGLEGSMSLACIGGALASGIAVAGGCEDASIQAISIAGATCAGLIFIGYVKDKIAYNKSKKELRNYIKRDVWRMVPITMYDKNSRVREAYLDKACEDLVDEFVMERNL